MKTELEKLIKYFGMEEINYRIRIGDLIYVTDTLANLSVSITNRGKYP